MSYNKVAVDFSAELLLFRR